MNGVGKESEIRICVTGHRPNKMYGYDLSDGRYQTLKEKFKEILIREGCREGITGMALGVDTVFALAVLELKEEGYPIKLHCAIPCRNQSKSWQKESKKLYEEILEKADIVHLVSDEEYKPYLMQKRNTYMVDLSNKVIAVWDGSSSGTGNCVAYAQKKGKEVIRIIP
ncbi:MAG: SLOG family protein [Lachnospiraceae bacterium]|nr:SLOG family protein [Lachnospiraceae bacterium]MDU3181752.1 SLOG family protein [Lachnospiraceae bacterium]